MGVIIGVNTSHDVSFCVLNGDGRTLWLLEEERYNRIKHTEYFSFHAIENLIRDGDLDPGQVTDLAYGFEADPEQLESLERRCLDNVRRDFGPDAAQAVAGLCRRPALVLAPVLGLGRARSFQETDTALRAIFPKAAISSWNHHRTHAASAWYPSPLREPAAVLVIDGAGRLETATIWRADEGGLHLLQQTELPHSMGIFYWLVAHALCLEEGQVMGLAAYGRPRFAHTIRDHVISIEPAGGFRFLAPLFAWGTLDAEPACDALVEIVGLRRRRGFEEPLTQVHADFAASAQVVTEEILLHLARRCRALTDCSALSLAGGVMQNSLALGMLVRSGPFERYWTQPVPHDAGSAWGAALLVAAERQLPHVRSVVDTAFSGHACSNAVTVDALRRVGVRVAPAANAVEQAASALAHGEIVAWFRGRPEVGPRALGARSLLAHPAYPLSHFRLNRVKGREPWRPLAPVFRAQDAGRFLEECVPSPHMNLCFRLRRDAVATIPAAAHADGTARVQTVDCDDSGGFWRLLAALERQGETPCLLNTSFNGCGEPLVQTPLEALRLFALGGIDRLFLGDIIVDGAPEVTPELGSALRANRFIQRYVDLIADRTVVLLDAGLDSYLNERARDLTLSLRWAGITLKRVQVEDSNRNRTFDSSGRPPAVITLQVGVDLSMLPAQVWDALSTAPWIVVSGDLYPSASDLGTLQAQLRKNVAELDRLRGGRALMAWMDRPSWDRFRREVTGVDIHWCGDDCVPAAQAESLIVVSPLVAARHRRKVAPQAPRDAYVIWASIDRDEHR